MNDPFFLGGSVVNADNHESDNRRQSIAFFHNLNGNAVVETIESCLNADGSSKYETITFLDFLETKHHATQIYEDAKL